MRQKFALCVGNNYPGTNAQLSGCINDAMDWAELLRSKGYAVEVLYEGTKADTLTALRNAADRCRFGDKLVFTYSGHGTWVEDHDKDENDLRDEALVPSDYANGELILDDELNEIFSSMRYGASRLMLSDSCHSGSVNRIFKSRTDHDPTPRFLPPDVIFGNKWDNATAASYEARSTSLRDVTKLVSSLISGCGDLEFSYDAWFQGPHGWRANGAFTRAAIDTYEPGASLAKWFGKIRHFLPSTSYPQTPQLVPQSTYRRYTSAL